MARYDLDESRYAVEGARFAVLAARFNGPVVERLVAGATQALARHGVGEADVTVVRVPGAFEIPLAAQRLAASRRFAAIVALGAIVRGGTPHFEYVARGCAEGVARVALEQDLPVTFGVLTVDTMEQAEARAGGAEGNKGEEAALAALEMVGLLRSLAP